MKKVMLIMLSLMVFTMTGCSSSGDSRYGEYVGDKYINKEYKFSMEVPKSWEVNKDVEGVNGSEKVSEDVEQLVIAIMYPTGNDRSNAFTIFGINEVYGLEKYVSEIEESDLVQDTLYENINGKDFTVLKYENGFRYLTELEDRIIEFNTIYSDNVKKDEIKMAIKSIKFE